MAEKTVIASILVATILGVAFSTIATYLGSSSASQLGSTGAGEGGQVQPPSSQPAREKSASDVASRSNASKVSDKPASYDVAIPLYGVGAVTLPLLTGLFAAILVFLALKRRVE